MRFANDYQIAYEYDEDSKDYKRYTAGKAHTDLTTGKQLTATNVLVITSRHRVLDNEGRRDVDVYGPGKGYLFQRGKGQEVTWERRGGLIRAYVGGQEVPMYPGQTWVNIIPEVPNIDTSIQFH